MTDFPNVFRDDADIQLTTPELTWRLEDAAPEVLAKLATTEPAIVELVRALEKRLPVQRRWAFGKNGAFVRPERHVRALYIDLRAVGGVTTAGGVIAIKGGEAVCHNFNDILDRLAQSFSVFESTLGSLTRPMLADPVMISAIERYPVAEGKPPGVHPHWDAAEESELALGFQRAHVERYGTLARAPVPLLVFRWPDEVAKAILDRLESRMAKKTFQLVQAIVTRGLGTNVYYYPSVPIRVMHLQAPELGGSMPMEPRLEVLRAQLDLDRAVEGWIDITSRLLALGFVATDPGNASRGYCLQPQNLVVDGGFVDVNSLRRIGTFRTEGEFRFAFMRTVQLLVQGITWLLVGGYAGGDAFRDMFPDVHAIVWSEVRARLRAAADRGEELHAWLADAIASRGTLNDVLRAFRPVLELGMQVGPPTGASMGGRGPMRRPGRS